MKKQQVWFWVVLIGVMMALVACSSSDDDKAPGSVGGRNYQVVISSGTGGMATTGTATMAFAENGSYIVTGDGVNTANDTGTYTYNKVTADTATITLNSTTNPARQEIYNFVFVQKTSGTFTATVSIGGTETGTFRQL